MDSISPPNRPHYPWQQGDRLIAEELNAAIANAGHGNRVTDWLSPGQPDGVTDNSAEIQKAIDVAAGVTDPTQRDQAPGLMSVTFPATPAPYTIGSSLYIPSNSHIIIEQGATLKLAPQTNANMFCLCNFCTCVLIELYGTLDGNSSQQSFMPNPNYPATSPYATMISAGITCDMISRPPNAGQICSHIRIIGDRNGLVTNFQNWPVGLTGATNCEVAGLQMTNSAFHAGSVAINGWRNFPYDPATGAALTFTGNYVAATGVVTLTTSAPHCMVAGEELITENITGSSGSYSAATGLLYIALPGTAGNTIVYQATGGGGTNGVITGGRITNWFYQQATVAGGTYSPTTGIVTLTTTAPHQLVYDQRITANITGGSAQAIATGIFQLLDVTDGQGMPPANSAKNVTLRYRTTKSGTTENILSGTYDPVAGVVTLTTDAAHGLSAGDVVTINLTGTGFLSALNAEQVCTTGTGGTTVTYVGPTGLSGVTVTGGTVYGGPTGTITSGTIGVSTKSWHSGFDNCFMDQIRDIGPCIYGGGVSCYIRRCEITRNLGGGPTLFSDVNSGSCIGCEISGNYVHDNYGSGIAVVNVSNIFTTNTISHVGTRIFDNFVTANRSGAALSQCDGLDFTNNRLVANRVLGLNVYGSVGDITVGPTASNVKIVNNSIRDPCQISDLMSGSAMVQVASGTYNSATGAVSLTTTLPHNLTTNAYFTLSGTTGTGATASLNGRYVAETATANMSLNFHAPAGLGVVTITGGQVVPNGFGICVHFADRLLIADNFIGDYQPVPSMLAAIGGTWGVQGTCTGNYYGPRINSGGNFPADMSAGAAIDGNNFDVVTGFTDGTTLHQPFSSASTASFPPLGISVGYNRSGGRGESNFYVGAGNAGPGGFEFVKVIGLALAGTGTYAPSTAIVTLTTETPHGLTVGSRFTLSLVLGTDSTGFTNGRDIAKLNGAWIATGDNAGTSGTTINFVLTHNVAGVPTPNTGLDIVTITAGAINASEMDSGLIDASVGLPTGPPGDVTPGGSLLAVDGYGNVRLSGALVHGNLHTYSLTTGGSVTIDPNLSFAIVAAAGSIASGTVVLPVPSAGSWAASGTTTYNELEINFQSAVGALTVTAGGTLTVSNPPTSIAAAGTSVNFIQFGTTWVRRIMA